MRMRRTFSNLIFLLIIIALYSCNNYSNEEDQQITIKKSSIEGAWEMKSIHWITKDTTYSIEKAQPGMFIFTSDRYSIMWTPIEEPRTPFQNLSKPTDDELMAGFRSIVFNCGTYEYSDSTITTTAKIAKVPGFEGGKQFYRYKLVDNEMELTMFDEIYPDGTRPEWYGKYQTKFVLIKTEKIKP